MVVPPGAVRCIFRLKDAELVSQLIDGNFPDYKVIIPRSSKTRTILSTAGFPQGLQTGRDHRPRG